MALSSVAAEAIRNAAGIRAAGNELVDVLNGEQAVTRTTDLTFNDSKKVKFGTSDDVTMAWDGTDFDVLPLADDSIMKFGNGTLNFDMWLYGNAASTYVSWDASADSMKFEDNCFLGFGTNTAGPGTKGDINITWNASKLLVAQTTANSAIDFGVSGAGIDLQCYGDTAGKDMLWDQSADYLLFNDDTYITLGTGADVQVFWSTADADNHAAVIALGASQHIHVTDIGAKATDWAVAAGTHPTVFIHSDTTPATDYITIGDHDGTEADINVAGGTSLALKLGGTEYASVRVTGLAAGAYVAASTAGTDQLTLKSTGTAPASTGANVGHLYADFETDDDELFWLSGTIGTATQLTT